MPVLVRGHFASVTPEQVNYDGNYPYGGTAKGLYQQETVEVKALPANGWGLHEMHGNVWEWCRDGQRRYGEGEAVDPVGPEGRQPSPEGEAGRRNASR